MCDTTDSYVQHDPSIRATWQETSTRIVRVPSFYARLLDMLHDLRDMTHPCVWYDSFMCVTWHKTSTRIVRMPPSARHDASMCVVRLSHMCDTLRLNHVCAMTCDLNTNSTHASIRAFCAWLRHMWHDSSYVPHTTHPFERHDSPLCVTCHETSTRIVRVPPSGHSMCGPGWSFAWLAWLRITTSTRPSSSSPSIACRS